MKYLFILIFIFFVSCGNNYDAEKRFKQGLIIDKHYSSQKTYITTLVSGKTIIPITNVIPSRYIIKVMIIDTIYKEIQVNKNLYNNKNKGDTLTKWELN